METKKPKISVMMLTHNRKDWLREAINSILNQTYENFELIIIDNASIDGTHEVIKEFNDDRIVYVRNEENLYPYAKNQVVDLAEGDYIVICDDDDISMPDRFKKSVEFLDSNPDVGMVFGDTIYIQDEGQNENRYKTEPTFKNIFESDGVINTPTVMMRKDVIKDVGGYDNNFKIASDYDLYLRIANNYKITHLDEILAKYRVHDDNMSLKNPRLTVKYRERALLKWAKVSCLCFSYNRVFQLESYIRSFFRFVKGVQLNVRYQYSEDKFKKGYEKLKQKYPEVNFIEGNGLEDFGKQISEWMKNAPEFVMFGCDDVIFKDDVDINKVIEKVKLKDTVGFSLRLGKGFTHHYPSNSVMKEPVYEEDEGEGILKWDWRIAEHEYGYPFELDSSVYKKEFVELIISSIDYKNHPNLLEGVGYQFVRQLGEEQAGKYLYSFSKPKALVIQINRVQDLSPNPFYDTGYDIDALHKLWEDGEKLNLDYYKKDFKDIYIEDFVLEGGEEIKISKRKDMIVTYKNGKFFIK